MGENSHFGDDREGRRDIGRVNFSKLLVQRYLDSRGEEGLSFACGKATYTSIKMFTILMSGNGTTG